MTSKLTRDRLQEIAEDGFLKHGESKELARMALAAMESEPVAYMYRQVQELRNRFGTCDEWEINCRLVESDFPAVEIPESEDYEFLPLYRHAQPAQVVPDGYVMVPKEPTEVMLAASYMFAHVEATRESWAAMLAAAPQPQNAPQNIPEIIPDCWCRTCRPVVLNDMRFVVCPDCGNKRCPRANDHRNACTGSNEPGQEGSAYPDTPQEVKP